jgi:DNA-binding transcriptional ArsR family regulator
MTLLKKAGFVISERHGQWTFYRRDEEAISALMDALAKEMLK